MPFWNAEKSEAGLLRSIFQRTMNSSNENSRSSPNFDARKFAALVKRFYFDVASEFRTGQELPIKCRAFSRCEKAQMQRIRERGRGDFSAAHLQICPGFRRIFFNTRIRKVFKPERRREKQIIRNYKKWKARKKLLRIGKPRRLGKWKRFEIWYCKFSHRKRDGDKVFVTDFLTNTPTIEIITDKTYRCGTSEKFFQKWLKPEMQGGHLNDWNCHRDR